MRKMALALFTLLVVIYLFSAGGHFYSQDEEVLFYVTEGLAERGDPSIPQVPSAGSIQGRDGKQYGITELTQSLLALPLYWAGEWLSGFFPPVFRQFFTRFSVSFFSVPITALTAVLLLAFSRQLGYSKNTSLLLALTFGIATIAWPYATMFFRAASHTLGLIAAIFALYMYKKARKLWWLALAGCVFGFTASIKIMTLLALPGMLIYLWLIARDGNGQARMIIFVREALVFGLAALPWAILYLGYNAYRFGGLLDTGYGSAPGTRFDTPIYFGLYGLLMSPGRSIFFYSPPLLLVFLSVKLFWREHRHEAVMIGVVCVVTVLAYASFHAWHGESSWGPRYLVPLTPLLLLPIGSWLNGEEFSKTRLILSSPRHTVFGMLLVLGVVVQIAGVSLYFNNYYSRTMKVLPTLPDQSGSAGHQYLSEFHFNPEYSPLIGHWRYIWPYAGKLWSRGDEAKAELTAATQIASDSPFFPIDPVEMQMYYVHEANNLDFWWEHWRKSVFPTIQAAKNGNLAVWLAQCVEPVPALEGDGPLRAFHIQPLRRVYFDCTRSWVYPEGGDSAGLYALHEQILDEDDAGLAETLDQLELAYVHDTYDEIGPAFRFYAYRPAQQALPDSQDVWIAPAGLEPGRVIAEGQPVPTPLELDGPLDFLGYRIMDQDTDEITVETWWKIAETQVRPLSIMGHVVDVNGQPVAIDDGLGVPVENWHVGDVFVQYHRLPVTPDLKENVHWVQTGVYWLDTLERHEVLGEVDETGDRILLGEIRLADDQ